jgi:hypothetical protein
MIHELDMAIGEPKVPSSLEKGRFFTWGLAQDMSGDLLKLCDELR